MKKFELKHSFFAAAMIAVTVFIFLSTGCTIDPAINNDPNGIREDQLKTPAGIKGLLVGCQTMGGDFYCSDRSRIASIWTQQVTAPPGGQRAQAGSWVTYNLTPDGPPNDYWLYGYKAVHNCDDLIRLTPLVSLDNDPVTNTATQNVIVGIGKTIKAYIYGELAAYFGSIPIDLKSLTGSAYEPAKFATQAEAYARVQLLLDEAIAGFTADGASLGQDLSFGLQAAPWAAVAHSLKARYFLHTSDYAKALDESKKGIVSEAGTLFAFYSTNPLEYSPWGHWALEEGNSIRATKPFIDLLKSEAGDKRLIEYFELNDSGHVIGYSATGTAEEQDISLVSIIKKYSKHEDNFPIVSSWENILIRAESEAQTGDLASAVTDVNVIRTNAGLTAYSSANKDSVIAQILLQKHLQLFLEGQNYSDMRRTKTLPDPQPKSPSAPGNFRFPYPDSETNSNPNTPADNDDLARPLLQY